MLWERAAPSLRLKGGMGKLSFAAARNTAPACLAAPQPSLVRESSTYSKLPKLPVPDAQRTLSKFLEFSQPLLSRKELEQTSKAVEEFAQKELPVLQKLLEERATKLNNWLTPWWLNVAYLEARTPLPVVTSPGVLFPKFNYDGKEGQIDAAAKITQAALDFYLLAITEKLKEDKAGGIPFDMSQYKFLFGTTRVPRRVKDEIRYGIDYKPLAKHIIVLHNGHIAKVDVLDNSGAPLPLSDIRKAFAKVVEATSSPTSNPVGVASSLDRDSWADAYTELEKDSKSAESLKAIEQSLFAICLDQPAQPVKKANPFNRSQEQLDKDQQARQSLHGGGSKDNSNNRWFDKTIQFVIGSNGYCGMTYEHTPAEGPPVASLMDYICDRFDKNDFNESSENRGEPQVQKLEFATSPSIEKTVKKAQKAIDRVANDIEVCAHTFKHYGKDFPKSAKISPDSLIQLAFQLAFFRCHGVVPPTYETATLRRFSEGRTENIRLPNPFTEQFCKKGRRPIAELYDALKTAVQSHKKYTLECMEGNGVDRHLLAWRMIAKENNLPLPSILKTPVYETMMHFQVPTKHFIQMCFGPSADDCYGICYNPQEKALHFTITTFTSFGEGRAQKFAVALDQALLDIRSIAVKGQKELSKL